MLRGTKFAKYTLKLLLNCDVSVCYGSGKKNKKTSQPFGIFIPLIIRVRLLQGNLQLRP